MRYQTNKRSVPSLFSKNGGTKYRSGDIPVASPFYYRLAKGADTFGRQMFFLNKRLAAVLFFAGLISLGQAATAELSRNVQYRGGLQNARIQFEQKKTGRVAFIGGSITQMNGYCPMVSEWLQQQFPDTKFEFINAGIASTCSHTGAFRLDDHVLSRGRIDLLFAEFAVNDDQDAHHARRGCILGMEGIIRQVKTKQPLCDVVVTHFVNPGMLKQIQGGKTPLSIEAHEDVLKHYRVSSLYLAREVADRIQSGSLTWAKFGGTHPKPAGNAVARELIVALLGHAWARPLPENAGKGAQLLPIKPIDPASFFNGRFLSPGLAKRSDGWKWHVPDWKNIPGSFRSTFAGMKLLCTDLAGSEVTIEFEGHAIGAYVLAGPDAGVLEISIDGDDYKRVNLYHQYSRGLHYPRTVMFATDLKPGKHTAQIRLDLPKRSTTGNRTARILQFTAN